MRRFRFSLEKILQLRMFKEEECKIILGQAISALNKIENDIKETAVKHHNAASQRFNNPVDSQSWDMYILRLEREAEELQKKAAQAQLVVDEKRALYLEALKDLKAIEKLKEKKQKEYKKEMLKFEMNAVDELTATRFAYR